MTTMTMRKTAHMNPQIADVIDGNLRVAQTYATAETVSNWYRQRFGLEFSVTGRRGRALYVTVQRKDGTLVVVPQILRTEPVHRGEDGRGPRTWECGVGFGSTHQVIRGFHSKIECTLTARQWFIAYGVSPDSPGGWL